MQFLSRAMGVCGHCGEQSSDLLDFSDMTILSLFVWLKDFIFLLKDFIFLKDCTKDEVLFPCFAQYVGITPAASL